MSVDIADDYTGRLKGLLERVVALQNEKAVADEAAKDAGKRLREAEQEAVEVLALSGLDGCRVAGKTWSLREFFSVSIPAANKEAVLKAAKKVCPEYIGVNTASLKSWLDERRKEKGIDGESLAAGTPFEGLVTEFREVRLSHRTVG